MNNKLKNKKKKIINKNDKIFLAGHNGLVGNAVLKKLKREGFKKITIISKKKIRPFRSK